MLGQEKPAMDPVDLQEAIAPIAAQVAPAMLGVAAEDLGARQVWAFNGDQPFLMGSAARIPILGAVMAEQAVGRLDANEKIKLRDVDLSPPPSTAAKAWPDRDTYTVAELEALARMGDATALDVLTRRIGGPGAVKGWLDVRQLRGVSIDRYQRQVETEALGLASFRAEWRSETAWRRAIADVPAEVRVQAARERATDLRDTSTPVGMIRLLEAFNSREAFPRADPRPLLGRDAGYLAKVLPHGAKIWQAADSGRADLGVTPESHAIALIELRDGRRVSLAVFLTGSTASSAAREAVIADAGRAILRAF